MSVIRSALLSLLAAGLLGSQTAYGLQFPASARLKERGSLGKLRRRQSAGQTGLITLESLQNVEYTSQIMVGGMPFTVLLDTGSSDLNVMGNISTAKDTPYPVTVSFASGAEEGVMSFATVSFAGYTVEQQIFNHVTVNNGASDAAQDNGLLGLGPSEGSVLHSMYVTMAANDTTGGLASDLGDALVDRIFQENTSSPNFLSFTLARDTDAADANSSAIGNFTLSEIIPGYESITSMPKLPVIIAPQALSQIQHWTITLDAVMANGTAVALSTSVVQGTPAGKMVAVLDSGFTLPQVPNEIADAFYKPVPGAMLMNITEGVEAWTLPCNAQVNASFVFAGVNYPVHPLDLNMDPRFVGLQSMNNTCLGAFQPIQPNAVQALDGIADMILGMAFLRNTYTLMNYGDFVDSTADATMQPYVQLLSVTNPTTAAAEFIAVRDAAPPYNGYASLVFQFLPAFIAIPIVVVIAIASLIVWLNIRRKNPNNMVRLA